jgi:hypothetical protein
VTIDFPMKRVGNTLVLSSPAFEADFLTIPEGVDLMVSRPRRSRSPQQHAWVWAVLSQICHSGSWDGSPESLLRYLKMRIGHGDWYPLDNGQAVFVPRSISFASCDQTEFGDFVRRMEQCLAEHLHVDVGSVFKEADRVAGPRTVKDGASLKEPTPQRSSVFDGLMSLALALDACESTQAFDAKWATVKKRDAVKALFQEAPEAVERIVVAARDYARGKLDRARFNDVVAEIAEAATRRRAA